MDQLNKDSWPALAMDLLLKSELVPPEEASSSMAEPPPETEKCWVCGCGANGRHYGVMACFGCKGFFRRSVQGTKNYVCRHERNCVISQNDRNCCRACRFEKCLYVGMDPSAIQPDRDKTGRQRNPRKSQYALPPNHRLNKSSNNSSANSSFLDSTLSGNSSAHNSSLTEESPSTSFATDNGDRNETPTAMDKDIIDTLVQIEDICKEMKMDINTPYQTIEAAIERPSTVFTRTVMTFEGHYGPISPRTLKDDVLRLSVLMLDYVNTLRPVADVNVPDKVAVVRQCLAPFIVLVTGFHSSKKEELDTIFLPSGHVLAPRQSLFTSQLEDHKASTMLEIRTLAIRRNLMDQVIVPMRRLNISIPEFAAVKAIMVLDPHSPGMSRESVDILTNGREAVQRALFSHVKSEFRHEEATARFAHLLMIITAVTRISSQLVTLLHNLEQAGTFHDDVLSDLFLQGL